MKDEADCKATWETLCNQFSAAPGSGIKPAGMAAIGDALSKTTCDQLYAGAIQSFDFGDPSCGVDGTVATGKACYVDSQCASTNCDVPDGALCGQCVEDAAAGASCTFDSDCAKGLYCDFNDTCAAEKKLGESCAGFAKCESGAFCDANDTCVAVGDVGADCGGDDECKQPLVCGASGKCKAAALGTAGATCDPKESYSCNSYLGFSCDDATNKCVTHQVPGPGEPCGLIGNTFVLFCSGGASCVTPSGSNAGTCMAVAPVGGACNTDTGPDCSAVAECINGTCQVADATTCPAN